MGYYKIREVRPITYEDHGTGRLNDGMGTSWRESAVTFKKCTTEKVAFILLNLFDLTLTVVAVYLGLSEINPVIRFLFQIPALLLVVKLGIPILLAWLIPGRLLIPAIALLVLAVIWNIKELIVFLA